MSGWLSAAHYQANLNLQPLLQPGETLRVFVTQPSLRASTAPSQDFSSCWPSSLCKDRPDSLPARSGGGPEATQTDSSTCLTCLLQGELCPLLHCVGVAEYRDRNPRQIWPAESGAASHAPKRVCGCHQHQNCSNLPLKDRSEPLGAGSRRCQSCTQEGCGSELL